MSTEILLLLLPIILIIGVPAYIFLREKMVKRHEESRDFTKRRVFKLTVSNFSVNSLMFVYFSLLFVSAAGSNVNYPVIFQLGFLFTMAVCLTYYGNGIYITAIVIENYTVLELRKLDPFRKQFVATHLFHGPISHVLIYAGWLLALFVITLLDMAVSNRANEINAQMLIPAGIIAGLAYVVALIYNGTAPYLLIVALSMLFILILDPTRLGFSSVATFFLALILTVIVSIFTYMAARKITGRKFLDWDMSGYEAGIKVELPN